MFLCCFTLRILHACNFRIRSLTNETPTPLQRWRLHRVVKQAEHLKTPTPDISQPEGIAGQFVHCWVALFQEDTGGG